LCELCGRFFRSVIWVFCLLDLLGRLRVINRRTVVYQLHCRF
jgi:hypothetical protein